LFFGDLLIRRKKILTCPKLSAMYIEENVKTEGFGTVSHVEMTLPAAKRHTSTRRNKSDYELKRGKPLPSKHHSCIQSQLCFILMRDYGKQFQLFSELDLDFKHKFATPDVCIYPKMKFDYEKDEDVIKMTEPPLATIEILSPEQPFYKVISNIRQLYFPNQVKSAWVIIPVLKAIILLVPEQETKYFNSGKLLDPTNGIEVLVQEVFKV
jgi:hypothetical protein